MLAFIPLSTFIQQLEDLFFLCLQKEKFHTALAVKKLQLKIMNDQQKENKKNTSLQREDDSSQTQGDPPPSSSCIQSLPDTQLTEINVSEEITSPARSPSTQALTSPSIMALPLPQPITPSATSASTSPTDNIQAHTTPTQQHNTSHKQDNHHNRPLSYNISSRTTSLKSPSPTYSRIDILTSKLLSSTQNLYDILMRKKE